MKFDPEEYDEDEIQSEAPKPVSKPATSAPKPATAAPKTTVAKPVASAPKPAVKASKPAASTAPKPAPATAKPAAPKPAPATAKPAVPKTAPATAKPAVPASKPAAAAPKPVPPTPTPSYTPVYTSSAGSKGNIGIVLIVVIIIALLGFGFLIGRGIARHAQGSDKKTPSQTVQTGELSTTPSGKYLTQTDHTLVQFTDGRFAAETGSSKTMFTFSSSRYSYTSNSITITLDRVQNDSAWQSGNLRLYVWLCKNEYTGGSIDSVWSGYIDRNPLTSNYGYSDLTFTKDISSVPAGEYKVVVTVNELYEDGKYYIINWVNYNGYVKRTHPLVTTADGKLAQSKGSTNTAFAAENVQFAAKGSLLTVTADTVKPKSPWKTGELQFLVAVTDAPYTGGALNAVYSKNFSRDFLDAGQFYKNVHLTVEMPASLKDGEYTVVFAFKELHEDGNYYIVDWINSSEPVLLKHGK